MFPENVWRSIGSYTDNSAFAALASTCQMLHCLASDVSFMEQRCRTMRLPHGLYFNLLNQRQEPWINGMLTGRSRCDDVSSSAIWHWYKSRQHGLEELSFSDGRCWGQRWHSGQLHGLEYHLDSEGRPISLQLWEHGEREGVARTWNQHTRQLESYLEWRHGQLHGLEQSFEQGQLIEQKQWRDGHQVGQALAWWQSGNLRDVVHFSDDGKRNGVGLSFFDDVDEEEFPILRLRIYFVDDEEHGKEEIYFKNGKLRILRHWVSGKQNGPTVQYDVDGYLREEAMWQEGVPIGVHHSWHSRSRGGGLAHLIPHSGGLRHGTERRWYRNGSLAQVIQWEKGKKHGIETRFYPDGQSWHSVSWVAGVKDGIEQEWINGITISLLHWKKGLLNGVARQYSNVGQLLSLQKWESGHKHGCIEEWYSTGQLRKSVFWKHGEKNGHCRKYHENGQLAKEVFWRSGSKMGLQRNWYSNGNMAEMVRWRNGFQVGFHIIWSFEGWIEAMMPYVGGELHGIGWNSDGLIYFWYDEEVPREFMLSLLNGAYSEDPETGATLIWLDKIPTAIIEQADERSRAPSGDLLLPIYEQLPRNEPIEVKEVSRTVNK